jgi:hypothetical protein
MGGYTIPPEGLCLDQLRSHVAQAIVAERHEHVVEIPRANLRSSVKRAHSLGALQCSRTTAEPYIPKKGG